MFGSKRGAREGTDGVRTGLSVGGDTVRWMTASAIRAPRQTAIVWLVLVIASALAATQLRVETSISSLLDVSGESWATYQRSVERHGGDEFVSVVLEAPSALDSSVLERLVSLTDRLESLPGVERVDGLASVALIRGGADGEIRLSPPLADGVPKLPEERDRLANELKADLLSPGAYVSEDQTAVALNVVLDEDIAGDRNAVVERIVELVGEDALISGVPIFRTRINSDTLRESLILSPLTLVLMSLILFAATRSLVATVLPLVVGGVGNIATLGALGVADRSLSLSTLILPSVLLALGCAYAMHVVAAVGGVRSREELEHRLSDVVIPVALSGLTTALGFLALSMTTIETIRDLSFFGAYGVLVITAASVSLLPALLAFESVSIPSAKAYGWLRGTMSRWVAQLCADRPRTVVAGWGLVLLLSAGGLGSLVVSTDIVSWYPPESKIRSDYEGIRDALSGITPVSIFVESLEGRSAVEPDVVAALDRLSAELEARDDVGKVLGVNHPLRMMRSASLGAPSGLPETRAEAQQYLLLLESEEPIWDVISRDQQSARLAMRVDDNGSASIMELAEWAEGWWRENGPADFKASSTGVMFEFAKTNQVIVRTQLVGLAVAFAGVVLVLSVLLRDARRAAVALIPNLIPLGVAYGAMGYFGIPLDAGTACLGSLALGIAVDDTIHVAASWRRERAGGVDRAKALESALSSIMPALAISSACIVAGFAALGISELGLVRNLGLVVSGVVFVCWAADLTLLPVLLEHAGGSERRSGQGEGR